ncbi:MAG: hypothetical protein Q9164_007589, partial [Protoblastenia rupestris]
MDFAESSEAYFVTSRAEEFQDAIRDPLAGYGLRILGDEYHEPEIPNLAFFGDRWPRITYRVNDLTVTVQMLVNKGVVIQQFSVNNTSSESKDLDIVLDVDFRIQELDYMRSREPYAKTPLKGPYGYGAVVVGTPEIEAENLGSKDSNITHVKDQERIGAVLGVFKDGDSLILPTPDNNHLPVLTQFPLKCTETLQLTAAYRLQDIDFSHSWRDFLLPSTDVDVNELTKDIYECPPEWPVLENGVPMKWHLRRNLEHILS